MCRMIGMFFLVVLVCKWVINETWSALPSGAGIGYDS